MTLPDLPVELTTDALREFAVACLKMSRFYMTLPYVPTSPPILPGQMYVPQPPPVDMRPTGLLLTQQGLLALAIANTPSCEITEEP